VNNLVKRRGVLAHLLGVGVVGHPTGRLAGRNFVHHSVNLLKRKPLGLGDEEVGEENTDEACRTPEEEYLGSEVCLLLSDEVGSDDSTMNVLA
jgi:hypothetical protein